VKVGHWKDVDPIVFNDENAKALKRVLIKTENYVMRLFTLPVEGFTPFHSHDWEHGVFVLKGKIKLKGKDKEHILEEGNFAFVSPNEFHGFENIGQEEAQFICVIPSKGGE
jgi:quercetin dioxygenase-like cupin family protein